MIQLFTESTTLRNPGIAALVSPGLLVLATNSLRVVARQVGNQGPVVGKRVSGNRQSPLLPLASKYGRIGQQALLSRDSPSRPFAPRLQAEIPLARAATASYPPVR